MDGQKQQGSAYTENRYAILIKTHTQADENVTTVFIVDEGSGDYLREV